VPADSESTNWLSPVPRSANSTYSEGAYANVSVPPPNLTVSGTPRGDSVALYVSRAYRLVSVPAM